MTELPIDAINAELVQALRQFPRFVLEAPTGSGKSTRVPGMLLDAGLLGKGQVIILQPRRLAARMLARRVAMERGCALGQEVGYQVRLERHSCVNTRILYVTEAILLRMLLGNPELTGVSAVLFDEFHERHLYGDVSLALALQVQSQRRPDLIIGVMSATLEGVNPAEFLHPCSCLRTEGRTFPVEKRFTQSRAPSPAPRAGEPALWDEAAVACQQLCQELPQGDVLIFMPGAYEIRRTIEALEGRLRGPFQIMALHGELPVEQQDSVMDRSERRKVIVATNIAETSLTIDGVRVVIDGGYARVPAFDPHRGINTLWVEKISQASAEQRAGRAGRTAPGVCLRLWSAREHTERPAQTVPEVRRLDLSEMLLVLLAAGVADPEKFQWFEAPPAASLARARLLLEDLGALVRGGWRLTPLGRQMAAFPLHPRYARMLLEAGRRGCLREVALICALSQGRSILLPLADKRRREEREELLLDAAAAQSDFLIEMRAWQWAASKQFSNDWGRQWGVHIQSARQAGQVAQQLIQWAGQQGLEKAENSQINDSTQITRCLLAGFSDQLARRVDRGTLRCQVVHQRKGEISPYSHIKDAPLIVAAEIEERQAGAEMEVRLGMNTAVDEAWLSELFPDDWSERVVTDYNPSTRKVESVAERCFRDLVLERKILDRVEHEQAAELLAGEVLAGRLQLKNWDEKVEQWIRRVNFIALHCPDYGIAPIDDAAKRLLVEQMCFGKESYKQIKDLPVMESLLDWVGPGGDSLLLKLAPERLTLAGGYSARVTYGSDGNATISGTVQQFYDTPGKALRIGDGKYPLVVELLAPSRRPVQVTRDLDAFWSTSYPAVRKDLKGRYPKHEWR